MLFLQEGFDDYYPCINNKNRKCNLEHGYNWLKLFVNLYITKIRNTIFFKNGGEITPNLTRLRKI